MYAIYERITVAGPEIVGVRLTAAAYAHGLALALPEKVAMARPTGFNRAGTHSAIRVIPIEATEEWKPAVESAAERAPRLGRRRSDGRGVRLRGTFDEMCATTGSRRAWQPRFARPFRDSHQR